MAHEEPAARGARAAARHLAARYGPQLPADVEAELHAPDGDQPPDQYADPVAIAALIVSAASLAWTIYRDLKKDRDTAAPPSPDAVTRTVTTRLRRTRTLTREDIEVITTTVEHTLPQPEPPDPAHLDS